VERGYANELAAELASTLDWWAEAGVDALVDEEPRDWLKAAEPISGAASPTSPLVLSEVEGRVAQPPHERPSTSLRTSGNGERSAQAEILPDQLPLFHDWLRTTDSLPYAAPNAPRVCPAGDPAAGLMILTAMPSAEDCNAGTLLSGASGRLFDRMLAAIGRSRDSAYLAGLSCLRPPSGRMDAPSAARCAAIARHHIALAAPRALLLFGDDCAKALLGQGVAQARGRVHQLDLEGGTVSAVVTLHPDYLLAQPAYKAHAWADLQRLMVLLG
jgi:uracil-DNA glycosylase